MKHFVYILHRETKDRFYIGSCADVEQRLMHHNAGAIKSTKPYRPWNVVYTEEFGTKTEAIKQETVNSYFCFKAYKFMGK